MIEKHTLGLHKTLIDLRKDELFFLMLLLELYERWQLNLIVWEIVTYKRRYLDSLIYLFFVSFFELVLYFHLSFSLIVPFLNDQYILLLYRLKFYILYLHFKLILFYSVLLIKCFLEWTRGFCYFVSNIVGNNCYKLLNKKHKFLISNQIFLMKTN